MLIRHCVEENNISDNLIVKDPTKIRHVVILAGKIKSLSGFIDALSHLNLDFPDHKVNKCVITKKFEIGSDLLFSSSGFLFATVSPADYNHFGHVDYTKRLSEMTKAVKKLQGIKYNENKTTLSVDKMKIKTKNSSGSIKKLKKKQKNIKNKTRIKGDTI
ncbi:MAG: hypothetical protein ACPKPY_02010 [Nitrososphaeraceae archaeon]